MATIAPSHSFSPSLSSNFNQGIPNCPSNNLLKIKTKECFGGFKYVSNTLPSALYATKKDRKSDEIEQDEEFSLYSKENMKQWYMNPPAGFSTDDVTDTSLEDELLEKISQSEKAIELAKKKQEESGKEKTTPPNKPNETKEKDLPPAVGYRVRVSHLPKKKNVKRDLVRSFSEIDGLVHIFPCETGGQRTREPVCKGYAVFTFRSILAAKRFIDEFDGYGVKFGLVEKKIQCKLLNSEEGKRSESQTQSLDFMESLGVGGASNPTTVKKLKVKKTTEDIPEDFDI